MMFYIQLCCLLGNRAVYRDIGGSDPERMAAPRVAEYVEQQFKDTCVQVSMLNEIMIVQKITCIQS
jgi:leucyl aminopeptidase